MHAFFLPVLLICLLPMALAMAAEPKSIKLPESRAAEMVKKLPKEALQETQRFREPISVVQQNKVQLIDEIRVYGVREPEDLRPRQKAPIVKLRESLDNGFRETPAQQLCAFARYIGLCPLYTAEGLPPEGTVEERTETRTRRSILLQIAPGTIQ